MQPMEWVYGVNKVTAEPVRARDRLARSRFGMSAFTVR